MPEWRASSERERRFEIQGASGRSHGRRADLRRRTADPRGGGRAAVEAQHARIGAESGRIGRYQRDHHSGGRMTGSLNNPGSGTIYTETVVYSPPEAYVNDVP